MTVQAIKFRNYTDEDFSWKFDGVMYTFPAGQETYMEDYKAQHFAKHLIDREINRMSANRPAGTPEFVTSNQKLRGEIMAKCLPVTEAITSEAALNIEEVKKEKKKGSKKVEEEFADLKKK